MTRVPRVVVVTRPTAYEMLVARHGTHAQAAFFLKTRGQTLELPELQHRVFQHAMATVAAAIPLAWRRTRVTRPDLDRFLFEPDDIVVALGQDGLVANLAKYLSGQAVIGINPSPDLYSGALMQHAPDVAAELLTGVAAARVDVERRSMVAATLDDGQQLLALNEIFVGHQTHQSARYRIRFRGAEEAQSSSGLIVASGTGSTGWAASLHLQRHPDFALPRPTDHSLAFFVREAWPSISTRTDIVEGIVENGEVLELTSEMGEQGVVFGDGIEADRLDFEWGTRVRLALADSQLHLVSG